MNRLRTAVKLGIIGYGEVGHGVASGLRAEGLASIFAYQRDPERPLIQQRARESGVRLVASLADLAASSEMILVATPGTESISVATDIVNDLTPAHCYIDASSATPEIKRRVAAIIAPSGALVADGAIEGSPLADGHRVYIHASGPGAAAFYRVLTPWGMRISLVGAEIGDAAAIRSLRTILQKGLTALLIECAVAANKCGVREELFREVARYYNDRPFIEVVARLLRTTPVHARRRSEEVDMTKAVLDELGIESYMTTATATLLHAVADLNLKDQLGGLSPDRYEDALDLMEPAMWKASK